MQPLTARNGNKSLWNRQKWLCAPGATGCLCGEFMMRRVVLLLLVLPLAAHAMTYFLDDQWVKNGQRFCKYKNGTVLNVGVSLCPLSIEG